MQLTKLEMQLHDLYLEYVNDFLTIKAFSEYHALSHSVALKLIEVGREIDLKIYRTKNELK